MAAVYTSENISLALHETIVHLRSGALPLKRFLVRIHVPGDIWAARQVLTPPLGWDALPEESNVLINPLPADASRISAPSLRKWRYDPRFF